METKREQDFAQQQMSGKRNWGRVWRDSIRVMVLALHVTDPT